MKLQILLLLVVHLLHLASSKHEHAHPKSLNTIYSEIKGYVRKHLRLSSITEIGRSFEDRPIYVVRIHNSSVKTYHTIVVSFGIHAREWASPHSGVFLIRQLLINKNLRKYVQSTKWFIIPVLNPDGYHYSTTKSGLWRKNRRPLPSSDCVGVDLNRNFRVGWEKELSESRSWCSEVYSGPKPMSEVEAQVLKKFLEKNRNQTDAYVDVHACAQSILVPYGYTTDRPPKHKLIKIMEAAELMKNAILSVNRTNYVIQSAAELYVAGGGADDFAFKEMGVPLVYTLELGDDTESSRQCFHPTSSKMIRLQRECLQGMLALSRFLQSGGNQKISTKINHKASGRSVLLDVAAASLQPSPVTVYFAALPLMTLMY